MKNNFPKINTAMKRLTLLTSVVALLILASCGSGKGPDDIRKQLDAYHKESKEIEIKIKELEKELAALESGTDKANKVPVVIGELKPEAFDHYVEATGNVEAVNEAMISPEINGQISAIYVKEGDKVQRGQLLAQLNTQVIQKSIEEVKTGLKLATDMFQRQERLWSQKIGSEMQYLEAKNRKESLENQLATLNAQLNMAKVVSPVSGVVERVSQKAGEMAMPGSPMIHVVSLDEMYIKANVSEAFLPYVKKGDEIILRLPSYPDFSKRLPVDRVGSAINPGNRTFEVQVKLKNQDGMIKPNMVATLLINDYQNPEALVIPSRLIKEDLKGKYIYTAQSNSPELVARKVYINIGKSYLGKTEVVSGLNTGDRIILDGFNRVSDGVNLTTTAANTVK